MPKKGEYDKFKNFERKIKSPFTINADFESILVPEDKGKQDPEESSKNKYQKHVICSYSYKLICVDKFSKSFKSYLARDAAYNFNSGMIEESKYCSDVMKKHFNKRKHKKLVMTKEDDVYFRNLRKCRVYDNVYVQDDVKVIDHCHITGKYKGSAHRDCNINFKLNHKTSVVFTT